MSGQRIPPVKAAPVTATGIDMASDGPQITFDQPVSLNGIPQYKTDTGALPTAARMISSTTVKLTYPAGTIMTVFIPFEDPAIRGVCGGYVTPIAFP